MIAWDDRAAAETSSLYGPAFGEDVALLVYASRLVGADPSLVQFGGGNTSLKRDATGPAGDAVRELWIKGSGRDLQGISPGGFTPLDLDRLAPLARLDTLADDVLVATLACAVLRPGAPFPSVETLLHAFVPAHAVVHTHAEALLVLTNQPQGAALAEEALGPGIAVLPYVRPGHGLARAALAALRERPHLAGIAFRHHGLFTFGETPREALQRTVDAVAACRALLSARGAEWKPRHRPRPQILAAQDMAARMAPAVRGAVAAPSGDPDRPWRRVVLASRVDADVLEALDDPAARELHARGPLTPDHLIRTRARPLFMECVPDETPESLKQRLDEAVLEYDGEYRAYVERNAGPAAPSTTGSTHAAPATGSANAAPTTGSTNAAPATGPTHAAPATGSANAAPAGGRAVATIEDARPRVVLVPRVGLFAAGQTVAEAEAAAEIARRALLARIEAERVGRFTPLGERDLFETEYWPPEQEKLRRRVLPSLSGRVALVTGAAGAIGCGVARALAERGARVFLADRPGPAHEERLTRAVEHAGAGGLAPSVSACPFDVTDPSDVERALSAVALAAGGVDLLVLSHGAALVGEIAALDPGQLRSIFEINALGSFHVLGAFVRQAKLQGTGGDVVLLSTKNVPEPGASFGAYSASKAAAHQLARVAAIELAPQGIRVNMVAPDAVFGDDASPSLLWQTVGTERARSRGIDPATLPEQYRQRNLLKLRVTAAHCAEAVLFFAERRTPTTGAVLPVDGGLPGAFPR